MCDPAVHISNDLAVDTKALFELFEAIHEKSQIIT